AVMTLPALERLREAHPAARIALLTDVKLAELWQGHPAIDQVLTFAAGEGLWRVAGRLRAERFDLALVLPNSPRAALEVWLARIPQRLGYARPWRNWCLTRPVLDAPDAIAMRRRSAAEIRRLIRESPVPPRVVLPPSAHQVRHYLRLVAALGARPEPLPPRLRVTDTELAEARGRFQLEPATRWLALNPGAEYGAAKRWPVEHFAAVANAVGAWPGWGLVLVGGRGDIELAAGIAAALPPPGLFRNLAGRTSLRELCAVLQACRVVLTNDTGPMHVAAAVGTPVVVPFGSTSPDLTGPGCPGESRHALLRVEVPCAPCFRRACPIDLRCLRGISVARVLEAIRAAADRELSQLAAGQAGVTR
ncbi:MAG: lipopolysaccharide heptosyltransferase II, partial [Verrucomicrobia bacterium]|nr:lipopolysaccharide heptosyltransferase II [Verrucomicrobiota bacterium]